jgi:hypothetical protein
MHRYMQKIKVFFRSDRRFAMQLLCVARATLSGGLGRKKIQEVGDGVADSTFSLSPHF